MNLSCPSRVFLTGCLFAWSAAALCVPPENPGRGGDKADANARKVQVCHKGYQTISISESALPAHLAHGDVVLEDGDACGGDGGDDASAPVCVGEGLESPVGQDQVDYLATLKAPEFDLDTNLVYLPQVKIDVLGEMQTFGVILEHVTDTDFLVRYVAQLTDPADDVTYVTFDGTDTEPFDVDVVPEDPDLAYISDVEFSVLAGCQPVQLTVTNFSLESADP